MYLLKLKYLKEKFKFKEKDFPNTSLFYESCHCYMQIYLADQKRNSKLTRNSKIINHECCNKAG